MMKQNGNPSNDVLGSVGSVGGELTNLAGLQMRLAAIDLRESMGKATPWILAAAIGGVMLFSGTIALLAGLGLWLASALNWPLYAAFLAVAIVALGIGAVAAFVALKKLPGSFEAFRRSREELERNLAWLKTILAHSGR